MSRKHRAKPPARFRSPIAVKLIDARKIQYRKQQDGSLTVTKEEIDAIKGEPVEPIHYGKWIVTVVAGERMVCCSECKSLGSPEWRCCPLCETKMPKRSE